MAQPPQIDRFEAANQLFTEALHVSESERTGFVRQNSGGDTELAASVLRLLAQFDKLGSFLEQPAFGAPSHREWPSGHLLAGRFRIVELIGRGGMGEVYRADDLQLRDSVALKMVRAHLKHDPEMLFHFHSEIKLARKISHLNVCRIFDLFTDIQEAGDELMFLTMEYLDGDTLATRLTEKRPLGHAELLKIAREIAAGLDAAHRQRIVHRDLKPGNVILALSHGEERAVITDFGLAKSLEAAGSTANTNSGMIAGSPAYMAPEQYLGSGITAAADIYALGLIVFEMAAGKRPFPDESILRTAVRRLVEDPPPLRHFAPDAPARWERAIQRALARDPAQRPASAGGFIQELESDRRLPGLDGRRLRPLLTRRSFLYAGATATLLAGSYAIYRYRYQGPLFASSGPPPLLMLTRLTQSADQNEQSMPAVSLALLIEKQLGQSNRVRLLPNDRVQRGWKNNPNNKGPMPLSLPTRTARDIAIREGANCILFGSFSQVAEEWTLRLRLEVLGNSPENPRRWRSKDFQQQDAGTAAFEAANWIRQMLAESATELQARSRRPEELTTNSPHALEECARGEDAWRRNDRPGAIEHFREALHIDPEFALAAARLADLLTASGLTDEGLPYYELAERLLIARNLTDRESLRIRGSFALDTGRYQEADHVFALYSENYPQDALPLYYRSVSLDRLARPEAAARMLDLAIQREPESYTFAFRRAHAALDQGRLNDAEKECEQAARLNARDWTDQLRGAIAFGRLDFSRAWESLERMRTLGSDPFVSRAYGLEACFRMEQGRLQEAAELLSEALLFDRKRGLPIEVQFVKQRRIAQVLFAKGGHNNEALGHCRAILDAKPGLETKLQVACVLARAGEIDAAQSCIPKVAPKWPIHQHWLMRLRGEIAMAQGSARRALEWMRGAPKQRSEGEWPLYLVRAAWASGETVLVHQWLAGLFINPGRFWFSADISEPGFVRWALHMAVTSRFNPTQPESSKSIQALVNYFNKESTNVTQ